VGFRSILEINGRRACVVALASSLAACASIADESVTPALPTAPANHCRDWFEKPAHESYLGSLDVSHLRAGHRYLAVTHVAPPGHHFRIWHRDIEPSVFYVRVTPTTSGDVGVVFEWGEYGALGVRPPNLAPTPDAVAPLARRLEARFVECFQRAREVNVEYADDYREVKLVEFIPSLAGRRVGSFVSQSVTMDAELKRVIRSDQPSTGHGPIGFPRRAQWLSSSGSSAGELLTAKSVPESLVGELGDAARRFDAELPPAEP